MALGKKTGGRVKGSVGRATAEAYEAAKATGIMPVDYMLQVMRDITADFKRRDAMAAAVAPYVHKKMGNDGTAMETTITDTDGKKTSILVSFVSPNQEADD